MKTLGSFETTGKIIQGQITTPQKTWILNITDVSVCIAVLQTLDAGLLARSQYPEGPATGHLDTGFSRFLCACKQMLRWFPRFQVATTCFSCSPPDLNFLDPYFIFMLSLFQIYVQA
jgi:hypothetical protein